MTTIVTRSGKGSPLTHTEVDTNFTNLNTAKLETAAIPLGTLQAPSVSFLNDSDTGIFCPQGGNSLAIATGGQYAITCSSTQAVGIKTANPQGALQVAGSTRIGANDATDAFLEIGEGATGNRNSYIDIVADTTYTDYGLRVIRNNTGANATSELKHRGTGALNFTTEEAAPIVFYTTNSPALTITSGGLVGIGASAPGSLLQVGTGAVSSTNIAAFLGGSTTFENETTGNGPSITFNSDLDTGILNPSANTLGINTGGTRVITISDTQRVGIGTNSPGSYSTYGNKLVVYGTGTNGPGITIATGAADTGSLYFADGTTGNEAFRGAVQYAHADDSMELHTSGTVKVKIDSSGRLLVGTSSTSAACTTLLQATGGTGGTLILSRNAATPADGEDLGFISFNDSSHIYNNAVIRAQRDGGTWNATTSKPTRLVFSTTADGGSSPTERMRITAGGDIHIGTGSTSVIYDQTSVFGVNIGAAGLIQIARNNDAPLLINRIGGDGNLVLFSENGTLEGSISVSGTTVSYNGAHLSRWSQLASSAERTEILRGSVLSNIDEMCEWGDEDNEQLNRMKVSTVEGDKNVSGVFQCWDDDDDTYINDFYCAMTGDFIIRIAEGVTIQRGDLLMSAGDGTAKPQGDGYVQDKTIAKITSTNVSCTYEDGSYCVPCVLMAC